MKKRLCKALSVILSALLLLGIVPAGIFPESEFATLLGGEAEAASLSVYSATAAAEWAKAHVYDYNSVLLGTGYYSDGGDCANFVSQCLYMGGLDMDSLWNTSGYFAHWGYYYDWDYTGSFIRCDQLYRYLQRIGAQVIRNPAPWQVSVGDVLIYCDSTPSDMTHSAIVIDVDNGVPNVAAHSVDGYDWAYTSKGRGYNWHLRFTGDHTFLLKLNGSTCEAKNPRSFDVYTAGYGDLGLYAGTNTYSGTYTSFISGEYAHVYRTVYANGCTWGYTFRYGCWGWIRLSSFYYQRHIQSPDVTHLFGAWQTVRVANCQQDGQDRRVCRRCGYTQTRTTKGGHVTDPAATCLTPGSCKLCGVQTQDPLGHDWDAGTVTTQPTCLEEGVRTFICKRDASHTRTEPVPALGHDYLPAATAPSCIADGTTVYTCARCGDSYVTYADEGNTWSDWTTTALDTSTWPAGKVKTKTQYRFSDYETKESTATKMDGWTRIGSRNEYGPWGGWSAWWYGSASSSETREVQTGTVYGYYYFACPNCGAHMHGWGENTCYTWAGGCGGSIPENSWHEMYSNVNWNSVNRQDWYGTGKYANTYFGERWFEYSDIQPQAGYRYRDRTKTVYYNYERWTDYSAWQDAPIEESATRRVETRTLYSYDLKALGHLPVTSDDKIYMTQDQELFYTDGALSDHTCYKIGTVCGRCDAELDVTVYDHDIPDFDTEREAYEVLESSDPAVKIYKGYCRGGCGCYVIRTESQHSYTVTTVAPTCLEQGYDLHTCIYHDNCSYTDNYTDALGHSTENGRLAYQAPTCTQPGYSRVYCERCGEGRTQICDYYEEEIIPALGHAPVRHEAVTETCLTDGNSEYYVCSRADCGKYFADADCTQEIEEDSWIIPCAGSHVPSEEGRWVTVREAKCGVSKYEECYCTRALSDGSVCDALIDDRESEITEHHIVVVDAVNAKQLADGTWVGTTCAEDCYLIMGCDNEWNGEPCDMPHYNKYLPVEHTPEVTRTEPSCVHAGHLTEACAVCGKILREENLAPERDAHDYELVETIESPCAAGSAMRHYVCRICGETECEACAAAGQPHHYWEGAVADHDLRLVPEKSYDADCTNAGLEYYACANPGCSYTETVVIEPKGHRWNGGETVSVTCTEDGCIKYTCTVCGIERSEITAPAPGHDYSGDYQITKASCTEDGKKDLFCVRENSGAVCGAHLETVVIPSRGHSFGDWYVVTPATCLEEGMERRDCANTDETALYHSCDAFETRPIPAVGHDYRKIDEKCVAPDYGTEGYDYYECAHDASHFYTVTIPALVKNTYTVTFIADGEVVAVVPYTEGDKFVDEPQVPEKDNHTGEWPAYTLNDTDLVVEAVYTPIDMDNISEIHTEKTVDSFDDGTASITLSAFAATRAVRFTSAEKKPVDVILVLDLSGSMDEKLGEQENRSKMDALKLCAVNFIEKINRAGDDNRVALVGFASGTAVPGYTMTPYQNTKLILTNHGGAVPYDQLASGNKANQYYADAFMATGTVSGVDSRIINAIAGLEAGGSTNTQLGLLMAKNILSQYSGDGREKVVVLLTDGNPTSASSHEDEIRAVAPHAIAYAKEIKNSGVKLYTVGVDANADAAAAFDGTPEGITKTGTVQKIGNAYKNVVTYDFNRFLNIVSSNYPSAAAMNNYGEKKNDGYYMSVTDTSNLDGIFSKIFISSIDKPVAFTRCNIVDTLSADFVLTLEQEYAFRAQMAALYNIPDSAISVTRNDDGTTTIRVNGVPVVKKIVDGKPVYIANVNLEASLKNYAAGSFATNTEDAYAEVGGERIAGFDVPEKVTVAADRNIVVFKINGEIYRIEEGSLGSAITAPVTQLATWAIPEGTVITGNYAEFEAAELCADTYTVTWDINGETTTETYSFGAVINVPAVPAREDLDFAGFSPAVPHIMPAKNLTFTAVYAPRHVHRFKQTGYYGTCTQGLTIVSTCACGETREEKQVAGPHSFSVIIESVNSNKLTDALTCSVCGASENHTFTFSSVIAQGNYTRILDLSLKKNGTVIQPVVGSKIKIMVPWTNQGYTNSKVSVRRVDEKNKVTEYPATIEDGYLVFYADHFSIYLIEELDARGNPKNPINYKRAVCELNGTHSYTSKTVAPTCTAGGYTLHTCAVCGDSYRDGAVAAKGHSYRVTERKEATCGEDGYILKTCANDPNHSMKTVIKATGRHNDADGNGSCDVCGKKVATDSAGSGPCRYCHKVHPNTFFGRLQQFFHNIAYFFAHLFGRM